MIKHLTGALLSVFTKHKDRTNQQHKQVELLLTMAVEMETIVDAHPHDFNFPLQVASNCTKCCQGFVQINTALGHHYHPLGILLFHHTIKFHYLLHIGMVVKYVNPRLCWCFAGEDMMNKVKSLFAASHRGGASPQSCQQCDAKVCPGLGYGLDIGLLEEVIMKNICKTLQCKAFTQKHSSSNSHPNTFILTYAFSHYH